MNLKKISIFSLIILIMIFIPTISKAAVFSQDHSIAGIYKAMQADPNGWITAPCGNLGGRWDTESMGSGASMIHRVGGICLGHTTLSWAYDKNGWQTIKGVYNSSGDKNDSVASLKLAYITMKSRKAGETSSNSTYKKQIRGWVRDNVSLSQTIQDKAEACEAAANNYASSIINQSLWTKTTDASTTQQIIYKNGHTFIGPYHISTYTGSLTGATITTREGGTISTTKYSTDQNSVWDMTGISGSWASESFYIVAENQQVSSVKSIKVTKKFDRIRSRTVITQNVGSGGQNVGIFYSTDLTGDGYAEVTLPGVSYSQLNVKKVDSDTEKGISNIGIIVKDTSRGYIIDGTPATYTDDINKATVYTTNANGIAEIKNLKNAGTYEVLEVVNPYFGYESVSKTNPKSLGQKTVNSGAKEDFTVKNEKQT